MSTHWHVGMKVVCTKRGPWRGRADRCEVNPIHGCIYTIRSIQAYFDGVFIRLEEVRNPEYDDAQEAQFWAAHFRPVQPRKTSIEVFHRIRLYPSIRIREDA
jgi:hypothetical protein